MVIKYINSNSFWLSLSLSFSIIFAILGLQQAFSSEYVVQDDARQYVFWMQKFSDSELLPNDLIVDYYQSVTPQGYAFIYWVAAKFGVGALLFSKLLPMVLGIIITVYSYAVCMQLLPVPAAAFISTLLLNQSLWMKDDLASATPRAFLTPLFLAFLYYLLRRSLIPCIGAIALQVLIYPLTAFISLTLLLIRLVNWDFKNFSFSTHKKDYLFFGAGVLVSILFLVLYAVQSSKFAPTVTGSEARGMAEFLSGGRQGFFRENFWRFWVSADFSGMLPQSFTPVTLCAALFLPIIHIYSEKFSLFKQLKNLNILSQIIVASLAMFFAAHALLFKLYLPSRYSEQTFRIVLAIASGIAITLILDKLYHLSINKANNQHHFLYLAIVTFVGASLILYPTWVKNFPLTKYKVAEAPALYEFLQKQPKDTLIASLSPEVNNLPTFAQRSILIGSEYALPYHLGYYRQISQRVRDIISAQYSQDLTEAQNFIKKYQVDFWLLDRKAFIPEYLGDSWIRQYQPVATEALQKLQQGTVPALAKVTKYCTIFETEKLLLLSAECIAKTSVS